MDKSREMFLFISVITILVTGVLKGKANGYLTWEMPDLVLRPEFTVVDNQYDLVADSAGNLHAFFSYNALDKDGVPLEEYPYNTILYTYRKHEDKNWSEPVEILVNQNIGRYHMSKVKAIADSKGFLHVVLSFTYLQYAFAYIDEANSAQGWHRPVSGEWGMNVSDAALASDDTGTIHMVYSLKPGDIYYRYSVDGGWNWSSDVRISQVDPSISTVDDVVIVPSFDGTRLHVVWSENQMPEGYPPLGVYYAQSRDGVNWSVPVQLGGLYASRPALALRGSEVHVVWGSSVQDKGRYEVESFDYGSTWSLPKLVGIPGEVGGDTGLTIKSEQLLIDSEGTLYWIISSDFSDTYVIRRIGEDWGRPNPFVFQIPSQWHSSARFSGSEAIISGGNQLHILMREGSRQEQSENLTLQRDQYWHMSALLPAKEMPLTTIPTVTPTEAINKEPLIKVTSESRNANSNTYPIEKYSLSVVDYQNQNLVVLFVGIVPVLLIILVVLSLRLSLKKTR